MRGTTLIELLIGLTIMASLVLILGPSMGRWRDRLAVYRAATEIVTFYQTARQAALLRGYPVRMELTGDSLRATYQMRRDSVFLTRSGPHRHGVGFTATRPALTVQPNGLGWGAANIKIVLRRGVAAESLTTSRLGRLKRW